jgi:hypothetical protein
MTLRQLDSLMFLRQQSILNDSQTIGHLNVFEAMDPRKSWLIDAFEAVVAP